MTSTYLESLFSLAGKVAIVTGAARGNGAAMAEALLRAGASVLMVDVLEEELTKSVVRLKAEPLDVAELSCDLTEPNAAERIVAHAISLFGRCDILVNNAGITRGGDLFTYSRDAWDATYRVNLLAPFELSRRAAVEMRSSRRGSIINITSLNAELAFPDNPAYVAFKGALKQLTKSLALDLGSYGIRVNSIGPGYIHTSMTGRSWQNETSRIARAERSVLGRWGQPDDLSGAIIYLASDASSFVTGADLYVDGGWLIKGI
jgi:2-deoxy-D-gluconate 3-dehydrogenase